MIRADRREPVLEGPLAGWMPMNEYDTEFIRVSGDPNELVPIHDCSTNTSVCFRLELFPAHWQLTWYSVVTNIGCVRRDNRDHLIDIANRIHDLYGEWLEWPK